MTPPKPSPIVQALSDQAAADAERDAAGDDYVAQGWRASAAQARRDGLDEAAGRYAAEGDRWAARAEGKRRQLQDRLALEAVLQAARDAAR